LKWLLTLLGCWLTLALLPHRMAANRVPSICAALNGYSAVYSSGSEVLRIESV